MAIQKYSGAEFLRHGGIFRVKRFIKNGKNCSFHFISNRYEGIRLAINGFTFNINRNTIIIPFNHL